jgi:hypothetical protein
MGGIALGKGVTSSGLLDKMDILIRRLVEGRSEFGVIVVLTTVVLVSCFIRLDAYFPATIWCRSSPHSSATQ